MVTVRAAGLTQPPAVVTLAGATLREDEDAERKKFRNILGFIPA
jgi:hypothetical protein